MSEKLQKVLAQAGLGSRRQMELWISDGRISVNNKTASLGDRVEEQDHIKVDGRSISRRQITHHQTIMYHKTAGTVCSRSDPEGRETIFENLPKLSLGRWISVGRLDISTSGLLLLTTDGELANRLMHPSYELEREYLVRVLGVVKPEVLERLTRGVELDDGKARFQRIVDGGGEGANHWYRVVLKEGRYREVRRLWESQGIQVSRLSRIRFGPIDLPRKLKRGQTLELSPKQLQQLYQAVDLKFASDVKKPASTGGRRQGHRAKRS